MKSAAFCLLIVFSAFGIMVENQSSEQPLKLRIEVPDTIYSGQYDIPITMVVENKTSEKIWIRNPAHWGNSFFYISDGERDCISIKVKINPDVYKDFIQIEGKETKRIKFDYTLDKMFDSENFPSGEYSIYVSFHFNKKNILKSEVKTFYNQKIKYNEKNTIHLNYANLD